MIFTYRVRKETSSWLAECVESEAAGEGKTQAEAVEALRASLEERMGRPDAVAPPPEAEHATIELHLATDKGERKSLDLGGPGG